MLNLTNILKQLIKILLEFRGKGGENRRTDVKSQQLKQKKKKI